MERRYWPLLALTLADDGRLSPVQIQKTLFVLGDKMREVAQKTSYYHFVPYHYGPFDPAIYRDIDQLITEGLAQRAPDHEGRDFQVTSQGRMFSEHLISADDLLQDGKVVRYLQSLTQWIKSLSFEELIKSIYQAYPDFKANTIFRE